MGAASDVAPSFVSPYDPAAEWTGAPKAALNSDNDLIDVKFGVTVYVEALVDLRQAEVGVADDDPATRSASAQAERLVGDR